MVRVVIRRRTISAEKTVSRAYTCHASLQRSLYLYAEYRKAFHSPRHNTRFGLESFTRGSHPWMNMRSRNNCAIWLGMRGHLRAQAFQQSADWTKHMAACSYHQYDALLPHQGPHHFPPQGRARRGGHSNSRDANLPQLRPLCTLCDQTGAAIATGIDPQPVQRHGQTITHADQEVDMGEPPDPPSDPAA